MLNIQWLTTFKVLVEQKHFTRTAELLYMTQPGVSQHIKKLEQACGYSLLNRINKGFELTEQGLAVYQYALSLEEQEARLLDSLGVNDPGKGDIRLACSGSQALVLYPRLLELQQAWPGLNVMVEAAPNHKIFSNVIAGEMDLGIVTQQPDPNQFDIIPLGREPLCMVFPAGMPLSSPWQSMQRLGLIEHPDVRHYLDIFTGRCGEPELQQADLRVLSVSGYINQISQILLPVSQGLGFTLLPLAAVKAFSDSDKLQLLETPNAVAESLYLVVKRQRKLPARFDAVIELLQNERVIAD
ncbi:LysR family transcriptional regulator [Shewanella corallii]|uniref:LysR family transcriptional regulator n=1 Tax=Shewanella corallii TaxID=560080 RepID=A0ABT0N7Q6_9GAMM|nr:LysR family transcriptional regulator [Shewanella corallii]MCL2914474.1 LysR family transcriptional regulator [Shewanella corallii]